MPTPIPAAPTLREPSPRALLFEEVERFVSYGREHPNVVVSYAAAMRHAVTLLEPDSTAAAVAAHVAELVAAIEVASRG